MAVKLAASSTVMTVQSHFGTWNPPMQEVKYSSDSENGYMPMYCIFSAMIASMVVLELTSSRYMPRISINSENVTSIKDIFAGEVVFRTQRMKSTMTPTRTSMCTPQKTAYMSQFLSAKLHAYFAAKPYRHDDQAAVRKAHFTGVLFEAFRSVQVDYVASAADEEFRRAVEIRKVAANGC